MKKILLILLVCAALFTKSFVYAADRIPVQFAVLNEDESSLSQIVGLCDGTRLDSQFNCFISRVTLSMGGVNRKVLGGGPKQCFLQTTSDGVPLHFTKASAQTWTAASKPSILCGLVESYTLEDRGGSLWRLTITSKGTDFSMPMCKADTFKEKQTEYISSLGSLDCEGVKLGPNPGF
ncbi:MAG: hypothetical protein LBE33_06745 [Zoogloeaceae bacterium]|jgi:hypothetical protein|nr:hypothetical protein [Zoogloeaceae bacterium]